MKFSTIVLCALTACLLSCSRSNTPTGKDTNIFWPAKDSVVFKFTNGEWVQCKNSDGNEIRRLFQSATQISPSKGAIIKPPPIDIELLVISNDQVHRYFLFSAARTGMEFNGDRGMVEFQPNDSQTLLKLSEIEN